MQVSAINPNFTGRRENIDAFINLDDNALRQIAYMQTTNPKADKRQKRKNGLIMASIPVAAGIAAAVKAPAQFSKTARLEKLMQFASTSTKWFLAFGIIDLVAAGRNKLREKSDKVREFGDNHPVLSFVNLFTLSALAIAGLGRGYGKLADKHLVKLIDKNDAKLTGAISKAANKFDNIKILNKMSEKIAKVGNKVPGALKSIAGGLLDWSPVILGIHAIADSSRYSANKLNELNTNYANLKDKQMQVARARNRELNVERDFLLTNPKNADDVSEIF